MSYVDGFVLCVQQDKLDTYRQMAEHAGRIWMEHGALAYHETVLEDATEHDFCGNFRQLAKPNKGETVVFAWVVYKSRRDRDRILKKVMADPRMKPDTNPMPFDGKRLIYGGFEPIVER